MNQDNIYVKLSEVTEIIGNLYSIEYDFDRKITVADVEKAYDEILNLDRKRLDKEN